MGINSSACEESVLNTIYIDLRRVYWFPYMAIN